VKRISIIYIIPYLFSFIAAYSQNKSQAIPIVTLGLYNANLPPLGIGHFLREDYLTGSCFAISEGITYYFERRSLDIKKDTINYPAVSDSSIVYNRRLKGFSSSEYRQWTLKDYSRVYEYNLRSLDMFMSYRAYRNDELHTIPLTQESLFQLSMSPFKWKYISRPDVYIPLLLSAGAALLEDENHPSLFQVKALNWMGYDMSPTSATIGNTIAEYVALTLVALGEEMLFRGIIQTELSESVNPNFGLVASSVLFGLYHVPYNGWGYSLRAMAAGFYLGWQYQKSNYDLGRVIAIHFYIDFSMDIISFFKDPLDGRGVYSVQLK